MAIYKPRRDDLENQLNKGALWAVTYGDLMSFLMIFFLVLFSFSMVKSSGDTGKSRKYEEPLGNIQKAFGGAKNTKRVERAKVQEAEDTVEDKLKQSMAINQLSNVVQIDANERRIKLILSEAVLFDSGKAELKARAKEVLKQIAVELNKAPNEVLVEGHTDNVPIHKGRYETNLELSMARASSVIQYLQSPDVNMDPKRLAGIGYGEYHPVTDNNTPEGRAKNRRIEISLLKVY